MGGGRVPGKCSPLRRERRLPGGVAARVCGLVCALYAAWRGVLGEPSRGRIVFSFLWLTFFGPDLLAGLFVFWSSGIINNLECLLLGMVTGIIGGLARLLGFGGKPAPESLSLHHHVEVVRNHVNQANAAFEQAGMVHALAGSVASKQASYGQMISHLRLALSHARNAAKTSAAYRDSLVFVASEVNKLLAVFERYQKKRLSELEMRRLAQGHFINISRTLGSIYG